MRTLGNGLHAIAAILAGIALILGTSACTEMLFRVLLKMK